MHEKSKLESRLPWIVAGILLCLYFATLPTSLTEGDSGEWVIIAKYGGVPHPSGYPLYVMLIRMFAIVLSFVPVVTAVALLSALCMAGAAVVTLKTLQVIFGGRLDKNMAASVAVILVFLSFPVWRMANISEPFALNILLASLVILTVARGFGEVEKVNHGHFLWLGLWFGFGLSNHHSIVWMLPFAVIFWVRQGLSNMPLNFLVSFVGLILGLSCYGYFLWFPATQSPYDFYKIESIYDLARSFLRLDYGTGQLVPNGQPRNNDSLVYYWSKVWSWLGGVASIVGVIGCLVVFCRSAKKSGHHNSVNRWIHLGWLLSLACSGVFFLKLFNVHIVGIMPSIIQRFMALPTWLMVFPIGVGLIFLLNRVKQKIKRGLLLCALATAIVLQIVQTYPLANRSEFNFIDEHTENVFHIVKAMQSVLVTGSDGEDFAMLYGRLVLGFGQPDIKHLILSHWTKPHYRQKVVKYFGLPADSIHLNRSELIALLLKGQKSLFVLDPPEHPRPKFFEHSFALGPGLVLVNPEIWRPTAEEVMQLNEQIWASMRPLPDCRLVSRMSAWDYDLYLKYLENFKILRESFQVGQKHHLLERLADLQERYVGSKRLNSPCFRVE